MKQLVREHLNESQNLDELHELVQTTKMLLRVLSKTFTVEESDMRLTDDKKGAQFKWRIHRKCDTLIASKLGYIK